jgi:hypothetical protein
VIVLGLILIVIAVAAGGLLFIATQPLTDPVQLETPWLQASVLPIVLLIAGAAVMLLLWLGLVMIRGSVRRKARRRRENKELERQAEREAQARREAEKRAAAAPVAAAAAPTPAARYADSRERPRDGWAEDDNSGGRHAAPVAATPSTRGETRRLDAEQARDTGQALDTDTDSPSTADRLIGREGHETRS